MNRRATTQVISTRVTQEVADHLKAIAAERSITFSELLSSILYDFASQRPLRDPFPDTPRSAPCPCGSGKKYKRCCGANAPPHLSQPTPDPFLDEDMLDDDDKLEDDAE